LAYVLIASSPFLLLFTFSSSWMLARRMSMSDAPVSLSAIDAAQEKIKPEHPNAICTLNSDVTTDRHGFHR